MKKTKEERNDTAKDLQIRIELSEKKGILYNSLSTWTVTIAILAAALNAYSIGTGLFSTNINVALAGLTAILVALNIGLQFHTRAQWWWIKHHQLKIWFERLKRGVDPIEIQMEVNAFLSEHIEKWPKPKFHKPDLGLFNIKQSIESPE